MGYFSFFFERGAHRNRDEVFFGHHLGDGEIGPRFETQITVSEYADQLAPLRDRDAGNAIALHHVQGVGDFLVRRDGDGVDDHAALTTLDAVDFFSLPVNGHVAVNHADAALLRERNGDVRFRDRIHRGADDRDV